MALSLLLAAGFGWLLLRGGLPIAPPGDTLAAVTGWAVPAYLVTLAAVHLLRATRWRHLLRPLSPVALPTVVGVAWLGFAAVLFLPLRLGEVARPYLMGRRSEISAWAAAGTVAAERVLDGLILSSILFVALTVNTPQTPLPDRVGELAIPVASVSRATYGALGLFAAAFLLLLLLHRKREATIALLERITRLISRRLAAKLREIAERAASGKISRRLHMS